MAECVALRYDRHFAGSWGLEKCKTLLGEIQEADYVQFV